MMPFEEQVKIILESWKSTLPEKNVFYISGPMTTGISTLSKDCDHNSDRFAENCAKMNSLARKLRLDNVGVIDPSGLEVDGWGQKEYMTFWLQCIEEKVSNIYFIDGWEFSSGCLQEMQKAIDLHIPMFCQSGHPLGLPKLYGLIVNAWHNVGDRNDLTEKGKRVFSELERSKDKLEKFFK